LRRRLFVANTIDEAERIGSRPVKREAPPAVQLGRTGWRRRRLLWRGDRCSASDGRGPRRGPNSSRNRSSRRRRSFGLRPRDEAGGPPLRSRRQLCVADGGPPAPPVHLNNGTADSNGEYRLSLVARRKDTGKSRHRFGPGPHCEKIRALQIRPPMCNWHMHMIGSARLLSEQVWELQFGEFLTPLRRSSGRQVVEQQPIVRLARAHADQNGTSAS
jgi:hypothetical protein